MPKPSPSFVKFRSKIENSGYAGSWSFIKVPTTIARKLNARAGRLPIRIKINDEEFRTSLMPKGDGSHFIVTGKNVQLAASASIGDRIEVSVQADTHARVIKPPADLRVSLQKAGMVDKFSALSNSQKKLFVTWIEEAKQKETRIRRIIRTVDLVERGERLRG